MPVVTAEDASVGDTRAYRPLNVNYTVNVGVASLGPTKDSFTGAMVLSGNVAAGGTFAGLASKVNPNGTLVNNRTLAANIISGARGYLTRHSTAPSAAKPKLSPATRFCPRPPLP